MTRRVFWWSWAVFTLLAATWAVANPLMASPDEPAHVVRAAAVVRGQLLGPDGPGGTVVELPYFFDRVNRYPTCFMFQDDVTGNCDVPATQDLNAPTTTATPAGRYNPLYYAIVGLPTLLPPGDGVLYAMRLVSAALTGLFLALGMRAVAELRAPARLVPGVAAAVTPMVVFLNSSVNPAAIEIAAAFALWAQLLTLLRHPDPGRDPSRLWWVALSTLFFANARGLSLLWAAVIVAACVLASSWSRLRALLVRRTAWSAWAAVLVAGGAAAAWLVGASSLSAGGSATGGVPFRAAVVNSILNTNAYLLNMVGEFGWLDTFLEHWVYMTWALLLGVVLLPALAAARRRELWALLGLGASILVLPVLVHASQAPRLGIIWQGRYVLPVAVGLPLLAAYVLHDRLALPRQVVTRLGVVVAVVACLVQGAAFVENLHRYVNGEDGPWASLAPDAWLPPLPLGAVLALGAVAIAGYGVLLVWLARTAPPDDERLQATEPIAAR